MQRAVWSLVSICSQKFYSHDSLLRRPEMRTHVNFAVTAGRCRHIFTFLQKPLHLVAGECCASEFTDIPVDDLVLARDEGQ